MDSKNKKATKKPLLAAATAFVASYTDRNNFLIYHENVALSLRQLRYIWLPYFNGRCQPSTPHHPGQSQVTFGT
jgi:hypothetical protein